MAHVLVAHDGSPKGEQALNHALDTWGDDRVTVLRVIDPVAAGYSADVTLPSGAREWYESTRAEAEAMLEDAAEEAEDRGVEVDTAVEVGRPAATIVEYADDHDVDHIVVGSHGRTGVSRILLGSVAESVMRRSPVPVTVVR